MTTLITTPRDLLTPTARVIGDALYDLRGVDTAADQRTIVRVAARELGWSEAAVWAAVNDRATLEKG